MNKSLLIAAALCGLSVAAQAADNVKFIDAAYVQVAPDHITEVILPQGCKSPSVIVGNKDLLRIDGSGESLLLTTVATGIGHTVDMVVGCHAADSASGSNSSNGAVTNHRLVVDIVKKTTKNVWSLDK